MSKVQWIKIVTNIFDDEKIIIIESMPEGDTVLVIWFKLLMLAGKCNDSGLIYVTRELPYDVDQLAAVMRRSKNVVQMALTIFERMGMIEIHNNFIALVNWERHQSAEMLEAIREKTRARVQRHREKQKLLLGDSGNATSNVTVASRNAVEVEEEIDKDKEKDTTPERAVFEAWTSCKNLRQHTKIEAHRAAIKTALNKYESAEVIAAIQKYSHVKDLPGSLFSYSWILKDFLTRGLDRFVGDLPDVEYIAYNHRGQYQENPAVKYHREKRERENASA